MNKFTVRNESGSVDVDASTQAFREALTAQVAADEALAEKIESAVEAVFDEHGARLPKGMLIDGALAKLGATPETHTSLTHSIKDYLRANTSSDKGVDGKRIAAVKGQSGGLSRLAKPGEEVTPLPAKA